VALQEWDCWHFGVGLCYTAGVGLLALWSGAVLHCRSGAVGTLEWFTAGVGLLALWSGAVLYCRSGAVGTLEWG
jgi:hypothetical protein